MSETGGALPGGIVIQKGIPIPSRCTYRDRNPGPYSATGKAIAALEVGDSFVFPRKKREDMEAARTRAHGHFARHHGRSFKSRIVVENGQRVLRIWRTV